MAKFPLYKLIKNEYTRTQGYGKLLLIALFFNVPVDAFIPYLSQAITIITLGIFLKQYLISVDEDYVANEKVHSRKVSSLTLFLTVGTMIYQLPIFWIPFVTQLVTFLLLAILYAVASRYKN